MSLGHSNQSESSGYWRRIAVLTLVLGFVWLFVSLLAIFLVDIPQSWSIFGWPFSYAVVAFAVPLAYLVIIGVYALSAGRADCHARAAKSVKPPERRA